mmetsp:Transcript_62723/g.71989  ORF Transcript_62723/g.71989 Transcript_62723/m.71989 type:complete len:105 (+) Transcript_62723:475-789(+)|eukprot:CAMPEP_0114990316 /NCGR_PEP_ID=MMETSP0216-20121206/10718_1 /TAXON_ID=223996 /ORGANISM="Protocruzia adherens, Strain Boccale" /LENGTH=104 /DNA_ID=CAMNT_0002353457 /DNA_START=32 /DNA_END=346 /DNA_ORIENTATION=-
MSHGSDNMAFPAGSESDRNVASVKSMLERGEDPKEMLMEYCMPQCPEEKARLQRCEDQLAAVIAVDPTKSCLYRYRQWVTCVEKCVQPKIFQHLKGTEVRTKWG